MLPGGCETSLETRNRDRSAAWLLVCVYVRGASPRNVVYGSTLSRRSRVPSVYIYEPYPRVLIHTYICVWVGEARPCVSRRVAQTPDFISRARACALCAQLSLSLSFSHSVSLFLRSGKFRVFPRASLGEIQRDERWFNG